MGSLNNWSVHPVCWDLRNSPCCMSIFCFWCARKNNQSGIWNHLERSWQKYQNAVSCRCDATRKWRGKINNPETQNSKAEIQSAQTTVLEPQSRYLEPHNYGILWPWVLFMHDLLTVILPSFLTLHFPAFPFSHFPYCKIGLKLYLSCALFVLYMRSSSLIIQVHSTKHTIAINLCFSLPPHCDSFTDWDVTTPWNIVNI
jgi:hypothetical protein